MATNLTKDEQETFVKAVGRALRRAAKSARRTARIYGTSIVVVENGKVVERRP